MLQLFICTKGRGSDQSCDNHRGISLPSIAGKILASVLLNRLIVHLEDGLLPESQCGFRKGRGTVYIIFAARRSDKGLRHSLMSGFMEDYVQIWMSREIHHDGPSISRWYDGQSTG